MSKQPQTIFSWEAPEFKHYDKSLIWYIIFTLLVSILIAFELWRRDYFGGVTVLILAVATLVAAKHKPQVISIKLSNIGFHINDLHIPYKQIRKFWFVKHPHHNTLNIETSAYLNKTVIIELGDQDPEPINVFLRQILPEHDHNEPTLTQHLTHRLKI